MATKSLFRKPKKTKPKIIAFEDIESADNEANEEESNRVTEPLLNPVINAETRSSVKIESTDPSAPPEALYDNSPTGLANPAIRAKFMQRVYSVLLAQKTMFCTLIALFTYIPHLRKIFRKWIFDPIFYTSFIGIPLVIFVALLAISHTIRRKFALTTMIVITASMSLLISYAITESTATAFLYSMGFSDMCDLGVVLGSKGRLDFTKWKYISLTPIAMIGSSILAPTILNTSLNNTIWPSIIMTSGSTYLAANTVPVIRHNDLKLEPEEYVFAATQLYLNPEQSVRHRLKKWFCGSDDRRERSAYTQI